MLPLGENIDDLVLDFEEKNPFQNTKTFGLNKTYTKLVGEIDGLDALKQSIFLMLNIEADQYIIYPYTYGLTTIDLYGKPSYYVTAVLPGRIKQTLLSDNRITDVSDFEFTINKNKIHVQFLVNTIYGVVEQETVVTY